MGTKDKCADSFLCNLSDLDDLSCKSFTVDIKQNPTDIFVVRKDNGIYAYINVCPHAQAPLEWNPDDFLDENKEYIICAMHGARFTVETGACVEGPCNGVGLAPIKLLLDNDKIYID